MDEAAAARAALAANTDELDTLLGALDATGLEASDVRFYVSELAAALRAGNQRAADKYRDFLSLNAA